MADKTAANPRVAKGSHMETATILKEDAATWNAGEFLRLSTDGKLEVGVTHATDGFTGPITHYALTAGVATTSAEVEVGVITAETIFEGSVSLNSATTTAAASDIGIIYDMILASNVWTVDKTGGAGGDVLIVDVGSSYEPLRNLTGDGFGLVRFRILASHIDAARV